MTHYLNAPWRIILIVATFFLYQAASLFAQPCNNPIAINSIIFSNTTCGNSTGGIILNMAGLSALYSYTWMPSVSSGNAANDVPAGVYKIHITRILEPACVLDTTLIVNNSDGPAVQVLSIKASNCQASNGRVELSPANLNYAWSNGETGAVNEGLPSGCYIITATNPGTGCFRLLRVCVPNENPLETSAQIIQQAKCGKPVGAVQINVSGGSGSYSYSLGSSSLISGLLPGNYLNNVVDNGSGCKDSVAFSIINQSVEGTVNVTPHNAPCAGSVNGYVEFSVTPGNNFLMPFSFSIKDANGTSYLPGNLSAGQYFLTISDADGCALPAKTFFIADPPPLQVQSAIIPRTCASGGRVLLNLSGGNGAYQIDWNDLPGNDNPEDRYNLNPGIYSGSISDALSCTYPIGPFLVTSNCAKADTTYLILQVNATASSCMNLPVGVPAGTVAYTLLGGGTTGSSPFGSWTVQPSGCLAYSAGNTPGFAVDHIWMTQTVAGQSVLSDTLCLVVSISALAPTNENVYFAVQANSAGTACGNIPPDFNNLTLVPVGHPGLNGISGQYGTYSIASSACLTFEAGNITGYNVDKICVGVWENTLKRAHIICYWPSVLPQGGCVENIVTPENIQLATTNCDIASAVCFDIPYATLVNYALSDNGGTYNNGSSPCDLDTVIAYTVSQIPLNGPYQLTGWLINGNNQTGVFGSVVELVALMNQLDPNPGWTLKDNFYILGGDVASTYSPISITNLLGNSGTLLPGIQFVPSGSELRFLPGDHTLVLRNVLSGCPDSVQVKVICYDCPPVHNYTPDPTGTIQWEVTSCGDSLFCTSIPVDAIVEYTVTDKGQAVSNFEDCGNFAAFRLDTGFHEIVISNAITTCNYLVQISLNCGEDLPLLAVPDQVITLRNTLAEVSILANDIIGGVQGNIAGLSGVALLSQPLFGGAVYQTGGMVTYTPDADYCGVDSFLYQITDLRGKRSSAVVSVRVICDKVLIFNGISPNGDDSNDDWQILGIEHFPENEVSVFNRWGNLVFQQKGYDNQHAWNGQWNGRDLPDGTYFYLIKLGAGQEPISGYLQIMR